mmetsp:Transcript_1188/g.1906  ORF Transcript_1188/g.1906 Transcript_1188/m.1906 type:complete len:685 (-) Transcript_1188:368-2422(-)
METTQKALSNNRPFNIKKEISGAIFKQLQDKNYERRKFAGVELQKVIKTHLDKKNLSAFKTSADYFRVEYLESKNDQLKKGGLMAYSALASSLIENEEGLKLISTLIDPVLGALNQADSRVKFYAVETVYNIAKVGRKHSLQRFTETFNAMVGLMVDSDEEVRKAAEKLDSLLKTILVECEADENYFDSEKFMDYINEYLPSVEDTNIQQTIVSWFMVLDSIPDFDLIKYLHKFLEGFFIMLRSSRKEINNTVYKFLNDILQEISENFDNVEIDLEFLLEVLVTLIRTEKGIVRKEACIWMLELLMRGGKSLTSRYDDCLRSVLECLSDTENGIAEIAEECNAYMLSLVKKFSHNKEFFDSSSLVEILIANINHESMKTRFAVIEWIINLQIYCPQTIQPSIEKLMETLTARLNDPVTDVSDQALYVLCSIANYKGFFEKVLHNILNLFLKNRTLLENSGIKIVKALCTELGSKPVYIGFAKLLYNEPNLEFTRKIIEILCELLLTDETLDELRERLKYCLENEDQEAIEFFEALFKTWSHNAGAALSLTYLIQAYKLAYEALHILSRSHIGVELLKQFSRLVDLLDSHIFVHLRLQMLEHHRHPFLLRSLYAILMFLPPSRAYQILQLRLKDISTLHKNYPQQSEDQLTKMNLVHYDELITRFIQINLPKERIKNLKAFGEFV